MSDLCTRAQVKTYLGITDTSSDTLIDSLISPVSAELLAALNRLDLTPENDYTDLLVGNGRRRIYTRHYPINAVTSVTIDDEAIEEWDETLTGTGWRLIADPNPENMQAIELVGQVYGCCYNYCWPYSVVPNVVIEYNAGYTAALIPAQIKQAAIEWIAFKRGLSQVQQQNQGESSVQMGDYSETLGGQSTEFLGLSMPESVKNVIEQYRRIVI